VQGSAHRSQYRTMPSSAQADPRPSDTPCGRGAGEARAPGAAGAALSGAASLLRVRPSVDVVVPFRGPAPALSRLIDRMGRLHLAGDDTLTLVDNTPDGAVPQVLGASAVRVVAAPGRQSSYHARNRGAAAGVGEWLLFLDADVDPPQDLIDRYFADAPDERTAVLVGAVADLAPSGSGRESIAGRYARLRRLIDQQNTLGMTRPYGKTANCAIRRSMFEQVGGFTDGIRSGGDADLCFRLARAGGGIQPCPAAVVDHRSRRALIDLLGQRARHGSGAEWLEQRYPGFIGPRRRWLSLVKGMVLGAGGALVCMARWDSDGAVVRLVDPLSEAAFEIGRRIPNLPWREQTAREWLGALAGRRMTPRPRGG
jgi:GT2 family glycosyltransferase